MADKTKAEPGGAPEVPKDVDKQLGGKDKVKPEKPEPEKPETTEEPEESAEDTPAEKEKTDELDDLQTDDAVDDIIRTESDELLEAKDKETEKTTGESKPHWWRRKWFKWTLILVSIALIVLMAVPKTRYWILNTLGVRASASVTVVDDTTGQPLKNVTVTIGESKGKTGSNGKATVKEIKLGPQTVKVERIAFAPAERQVTIGWGSNPLSTFRLEAVGAQYTMIARDYLSNKPIEGAEASSGQAAALSDKEGKIVLTLEESDGSDVKATVSAKGYRSEQVILKAETTSPVDVLLVPSTKAVFVTKESGKYDVYAMDIDGKNKKVILPGTGLENANIALAASPDGERVAVVSTRDNLRTADGMLLSTLTLVNTADGDAVVLDRGEAIQLIDWIGNRVVYHMTANVAAEASDRHRVISFDYKANSRAQLAAAVTVESAASALGAVYYSGGNAYYKINPDGSNKQTVIDKEVWASYRTDYNTLSVQTSEGWYKVDLKTGHASSIAEPASYANNPDASVSAWVDKGTLQLYTVATGKDAVLHTQSGLAYPIRWLNDSSIIYRFVSGSETADYAISSEGGVARKVNNVTATYGVNPSY
jgi:hypothetical protein